MDIAFQKYQGAGNDFILIDNRTNPIKLQREQIAHLCHRHFGVGADGLMLLEEAEGFDFRMVYYNSDGNESTMCGNGGRCITAFAYNEKIIGKTTKFIAIDGTHHASVLENGLICLQMIDVEEIHFFDNHVVLNTGSPHYIMWEKDNDMVDVFEKGKAIRTLPQFMPSGINVNFVECIDEGLYVRTYERGVEDETLSCGTGVTAAAIASTLQKTGSFSIAIKTLGGNLIVTFEKDSSTSAKNVFLTGPALKVYEGRYRL